MTICDIARDLAQQESRRLANEAATCEQQFMDSFFPDRTEYVNHGDHTYTICGMRWAYDIERPSTPHIYVLREHPENRYRTVRLFGPCDETTVCTTLTQFGRVLVRRDEFVAFIDATYPDTVMGRFWLWLHYHIA